MISDILIKKEPEKYIKWMCYDIFISTDRQVFNLSFKHKKEILSGGSYGYIVDGKFRTKKWISKNCANVLGSIFND
jgi:hypothetical protein